MGWLGFVAKPFPTLNWLTSNRKGLSTQLNDLNENSRWREVGMTAGYAPFAPFISFPHILPHLTEAPLQERQECGASISLGAYSGTQKIESTWINPDQPGYGWHPMDMSDIWVTYGWKELYGHICCGLLFSSSDPRVHRNMMEYEYEWAAYVCIVIPKLSNIFTHFTPIVKSDIEELKSALKTKPLHLGCHRLGSLLHQSEPP